LLIWVGLTSFNDDFKNIVHRGYSRGIVENTLESVKESIKESYNGVEIDARKTSDGVIVLSHEKKITGSIDGKEVTYNIKGLSWPK
jgi:glycerophosphoryl diester phosphodiesterase